VATTNREGTSQAAYWGAVRTEAKSGVPCHLIPVWFHALPIRARTIRTNPTDPGRNKQLCTQPVEEEVVVEEEEEEEVGFVGGLCTLCKNSRTVSRTNKVIVKKYQIWCSSSTRLLAPILAKCKTLPTTNSHPSTLIANGLEEKEIRRGLILLRSCTSCPYTNTQQSEKPRAEANCSGRG
jgi:hypothetical protein